MTRFALSRAGADRIEVFEGFIDHPYNDSAGNATIGVGTLLHLGPVTVADQARWGTISRAQAVALMLHDSARFARELEAVVPASVHLTQNQVDALISLMYNCGPAPLYGTVGRALRAGNLHAAADGFLLWRNAGGIPILLGRRQRERAWFLTPGPAVVSQASVVLLADERRWVTRYDRLPRRAVVRRRVLRRVMTARRQAIWHAAQVTGWNARHRRQRYAILRARTT